MQVQQLAIKADLAIPMFSPLINLLILIFEYVHVAVAFISQSQFQKTSLLKRVKNYIKRKHRNLESNGPLEHQPGQAIKMNCTARQ